MVTVKCLQIRPSSKFKARLCQILGQLKVKCAIGLLQGCRLEYRTTDQCKLKKIIKTKLKTLRFAEPVTFSVMTQTVEGSIRHN